MSFGVFWGFFKLLLFIIMWYLHIWFIFDTFLCIFISKLSFLLSLFSFILLLFTVTTHSSNMNLSHHTVYSHVTDLLPWWAKHQTPSSGQSVVLLDKSFVFVHLPQAKTNWIIYPWSKNEDMKRNYQFWGNISTRAPVWWCLRVSFRESLTLHSCQVESFHVIYSAFNQCSDCEQKPNISESMHTHKIFITQNEHIQLLKHKKIKGNWRKKKV